MELGARHVIYKKLANFMQVKDVYVDMLKSVIFSM